MSESIFYGHKPAGLFWLLLRTLSRAHTRGILGIRTSQPPAWFWVHNGFITFAWTMGSTHHLFEEMRNHNLLKVEHLLALIRRYNLTTPARFIHLLPDDLTKGQPWDDFWNTFYIDRLRDHLRDANDLHFLWIPLDWETHERMVALDIPAWLQQALLRLDTPVSALNAFKTDELTLERVETPPNPDPLTLKILHQIEAEPVVGKLLINLTPTEQNLLWYFLWDGTLALKPIPQPRAEAVDHHEIFDQLMAYYSRSLALIREYLEKELGSLALPLIQKNVAHIAASYPIIFHAIKSTNALDTFSPEQIRSTLIEQIEKGKLSLDEINSMLEELLMLHLLSTRNVLGAHHYTTLVEMLQMMRKAPLSSNRENP